MHKSIDHMVLDDFSAINLNGHGDHLGLVNQIGNKIT